jgi:hypothetical protein
MKRMLVLAVAVVLVAVSVHGQGLSQEDPKKPVFELKETEIPYSEFWAHMEPELKDYLIEWYSKHRDVAETNFAKAEVTALLGRLKGDKETLCESIKYYERALGEFDNADLIYEVLFMISYECGKDYAKYLDRIVENATGWKQDFYRGLKEGNLRLEVERLDIETEIEVPRGASKVILGNSTIELAENSRIGFQMERVYRDWLSNMVDVYPYSLVPREKIITWHEGSRLRDILSCGLDMELVPLAGTIVIQADDGRWYAPDDSGVFRFEVLRDKIMYPTTKSYKNVCLMTDTHGISALVPDAVRNKVDLVIGCGDYTGKMEAAYYLATKGIDVYFPGDRFVSEVLGHKGKGVLIGSAPVRGNIIGNQPVAIDIRELIVVQDISKPYPAQYYDAPKRYFTRLDECIDLNLEFVKIDDLGETHKVVDRAKQAGAKVIAVRVFDDKDYEAVKSWLDENGDNRAVLFHTSLYPTQRMFQEFPEQTSFGDPHPVFE